MVVFFGILFKIEDQVDFVGVVIVVLKLLKEDVVVVVNLNVVGFFYRQLSVQKNI